MLQQLACQLGSLGLPLCKLLAALKHLPAPCCQQLQQVAGLQASCRPACELTGIFHQNFSQYFRKFREFYLELWAEKAMGFVTL